MADSPSHRLGELIGDFFEASIINYLKPIVTDKGYYLDFRHPRPARNNKREVIGIDSNGNKHKLDIVVEEVSSNLEDIKRSLKWLGEDTQNTPKIRCKRFQEQLFHWLILMKRRFHFMQQY